MAAATDTRDTDTLTFQHSRGLLRDCATSPMDRLAALENNQKYPKQYLVTSAIAPLHPGEGGADEQREGGSAEAKLII